MAMSWSFNDTHTIHKYLDFSDDCATSSRSHSENIAKYIKGIMRGESFLGCPLSKAIYYVNKNIKPQPNVLQKLPL